MSVIEFLIFFVKFLFGVLAGFFAVDDIICREKLIFIPREHLFAFFLHLEGVEENIAPVPQRE